MQEGPSCTGTLGKRLAIHERYSVTWSQRQWWPSWQPGSGAEGGQWQGAGAPSRARARSPTHPPSEPPRVAWKAFHAGQAPSAARSAALSPPPKSLRPPECTLTTSLSVAHVFTNWGMSKSKGIPHDIIRIKMSTGWQFIESIHGRWGGLRLSNCLIPAETQGRWAFGKPGCAGGLQPVQCPTGAGTRPRPGDSFNHLGHLTMRQGEGEEWERAWAAELCPSSKWLTRGPGGKGPRCRPHPRTPCISHVPRSWRFEYMQMDPQPWFPDCSAAAVCSPSRRQVGWICTSWICQPPSTRAPPPEGVNAKSWPKPEPWLTENHPQSFFHVSYRPYQ